MSGGATGFRAVVPLKTVSERKTRLSARLSAARREQLARRMALQVIAALQACPEVTAITVLSERQPDGAGLDWQEDNGAGLNAELERIRAGTAEPLLVVHGDLPMLTAGDVTALIAAAKAHGLAIAPDRHGEGTNAVALMPGRSFAFQFGPGSCALHRRQGATLLERPGLAFDVDTSDDLDQLPAELASELCGEEKTRQAR
jgi:2-phospho-L-lactate guanylyltransferase